MAEFTAAVYQNEFLPDGGTDVNAIVTIDCSGAGAAGQTGSGDAGEIIIVDTSGSMGRTRMEAAKQAAAAALDQIIDGTYFAVVAGTHQAYLAFPPVRQGQGMVRMEPRPGTPRTRRSPSSAPTAAPRWAPGSPWPAGCSTRSRCWPRSTRSCSPTARTTTRRPSS